MQKTRFSEVSKFNGLDPEAYLRDVLGRIADHPLSRIAELLPWHFDAASRRARLIRSRQALRPQSPFDAYHE